MFAAKDHGHTEIAKLLTEKGADTSIAPQEPLFELWVKDENVAKDFLKMSFLATKVGKENNTPPGKATGDYGTDSCRRVQGDSVHASWRLLLCESGVRSRGPTTHRRVFAVPLHGKTLSVNVKRVSQATSTRGYFDYCINYGTLLVWRTFLVRTQSRFCVWSSIAHQAEASRCASGSRV